MTTLTLYRVRFTQCQRFEMMVRAPTLELAQAFAEQISLEVGTAPFEAVGQPLGNDWKAEAIDSSDDGQPNLLGVVAVAIDQLRRGCPRWTIEEDLANAFARAKAQGCAP